MKDEGDGMNTGDCSSMADPYVPYMGYDPGELHAGLAGAGGAARVDTAGAMLTSFVP